MIHSIKSLALEYQLCDPTFKEVEDDAKVLAEFLFKCVSSRVVDRALVLLKEYK